MATLLNPIPLDKEFVLGRMTNLSPFKDDEGSGTPSNLEIHLYFRLRESVSWKMASGSTLTVELWQPFTVFLEVVKGH